MINRRRKQIQSNFEKKMQTTEQQKLKNRAQEL